ncbi:MAG: hypothetical protein Tsb0020_22280 [Haliangiales bacterium]
MYDYIDQAANIPDDPDYRYARSTLRQNGQAQAQRAQVEGGHRFQDQLTKSLYRELRKVAAKQHRRLPLRTLNTTALINEAWPRLQGQAWQNRGQFLGAAARAMHLALIDYLRKQSAQKRPNPRDRVDPKVTLPGDSRARNLDEVLAVHQALEALASAHPVAARVVEMRIYLGFTTPEIAKEMQVSDSTVERKWAFARAWLNHALSDCKSKPSAHPAPEIAQSAQRT